MQPVATGKVGYIRNVDLGALRKVAKTEGVTIWVLAPPGVFVHAERPLVSVLSTRPLSETVVKRLRTSFDISGSRTFDQDPRFGFVVLGEIASRALSPAVNDPGTAIDVIGTAVRLLTQWRNMIEAQGPVEDRTVRVAPISYTDVLDDVFRPVATDGASVLSVALRLQKAFAALYEGATEAPGMRGALLAAAEEAADRALNTLRVEVDRTRVITAHRRIGSTGTISNKFP